MADDDWTTPPLDIEKSSYTIEEFLEWSEAERLELSPDFQRGEVWKTPAKAFLIDTILRNFPIPPIHIRFLQKSGKLIRQVIDGQQRLTAVLQYINGDYQLPRPRQSTEPLPPWAGKRYYQLPEDLQIQIRNYSFRCEVYKGQIDDSLVYEIFSRINIHSVPLSDQELRNGRFFGEFKQSVYQLTKEHAPFWEVTGLFAKQAKARMLDAQFVSEAIAIHVAGMQDKKKSLDSIYAQYDADWPEREEHERRFRLTMDVIRETIGDILSETRFTRIALFYTLYAVIYHRLYGIDNQRIPPGAEVLPSTPREPLSSAAAERLRTTVQNLSDFLSNGDNEDLEEDDSDGEPTLQGSIADFAEAAARQTDNIRPRLARLTSMWELAALSQP